MTVNRRLGSRIDVDCAASMRRLRVLVEPSDYLVRNIGDTAMMTVALERVSALWPDARIQVLTDEPERLPRPGKNIQPLRLEGRRLWFRQTWRLERSSRFPAGLSRHLGRMRSWLRRFRPALAYHALRRWGGLTAVQLTDLADFFEAVSQADLLIVTGMGGITSVFPDYAFELLEVIRSAQRCGARTVMMGQGLGPISTGRLRNRAGATFRRLDILALRERRTGLPLVKSMNVPLKGVIVTGDDAIELACRHPCAPIGRGIGVNLRTASYADVHSHDVDKVRSVLHVVRGRLDAPLIGVPISRVSGEEDATTIEDLMCNVGESGIELAAIQTPEAVIIALRRCRVLVAGSYHAGVFALASGIPTVALVRSAYYVDKFLGLAEMFGTGCQVVQLDESLFADRLERAIIAAWNSAEQIRAPLRIAAQKQVRQSRAAYARLPELLA